MTTYKKFSVHKLSANFRDATHIVESPIPTPKKGQVLIKVGFVGINASDINYTAGKYLPGVKPPFDCGFECVGTVAAVGEGVPFKVGQAVAASGYGAFAEYLIAPAKACFPVPGVDPRAITLMVSGLTASIALEQVGQIKKGETVLVTAAAGGTGVFAVQLAKLAGCHVIGTCSTQDKVELLKSLGCDRVINYKSENLAQILKKEYPKGVDVVYESVGGDTFETCVRNLAIKGRLIVIGWISGYQDQTAWSGGDRRGGAPLPTRLLANSSSIRGFFLNNYNEHIKSHMQMLQQLIKEGKLNCVVDPTKFEGLDQIPNAIDYMYTGKNIGKVVVSVGKSQIQSKL